MRILIANRGEIACRVIRTAHRLGHETVAVYADPDANAPFVQLATVAVRIGPSALAESYLSVDAVLGAASETDADAVHPGYGFLSENQAFAAAVADAGLTWIGPSPEAVGSMGSKIEARRLAAGAGVNIIPGFDSSQDRADLAAAAADIGFPVLVKAAAGGGGKGIRIVHEATGFDAALDEAMAESQRSFGDSAMIVERYIQRPRHVEVQVIGDRHGSVIHLGTRECSVQRRYQKLMEEAPAPNLPDATRAGLQDQAVLLASAIGYDSAGTVEFIVDDETGDFFFLEMNTRLQVEHPVTEEVTGLDLVELQIGSAMGLPLPLAQADVGFSGHAIEARINAEDATAGFVPQTGLVACLRVPSASAAGTLVRWDSGIVEGSEISPYYDSMLAKLIVAAPDRAGALAAMRDALDNLVVGGLVTNTGFHRWLVDQDPVVAGRVTTRFLDDAQAAGELPSADPELLAQAARAAVAGFGDRHQAIADAGPWSNLGAFSTTGYRRPAPVAVAHVAGSGAEPGSVVEVGSDDLEFAGASVANAVVQIDGDDAFVNLRGANHTFRRVDRSELWAPSGADAGGSARAITSPFPAVVAEVAVAVGDAVVAGDVVVVIEAMKMLHSLSALGSGVVDAVLVAVGDQVVSHQELVTFADES